MTTSQISLKHLKKFTLKHLKNRCGYCNSSNLVLFISKDYYSNGIKFDWLGQPIFLYNTKTKILVQLSSGKIKPRRRIKLHNNSRTNLHLGNCVICACRKCGNYTYLGCIDNGHIFRIG